MVKIYISSLAVTECSILGGGAFCAHLLERISKLSWVELHRLVCDVDFDVAASLGIKMSERDMREGHTRKKHLVVSLEAISDSYSGLSLYEVGASRDRQTLGSLTVVQNDCVLELFDSLRERQHATVFDLNDPKSFETILRRAINSIWRAAVVEEFECKVAGVTFHRDAVLKVKLGDPVSAVPEPENKFDSNAIAFMHHGRRIGYVSKSDQDIFQDLMQEDAPEFEASVNWIGSPKGNQDVTALSILVKIK